MRKGLGHWAGTYRREQGLLHGRAAPEMGTVMSITETPTEGLGAGAGENSREHVEEVIAALNAHDAAAFGAFYSQDAVVHDPGAPEPLRGRDAIQQSAQRHLTWRPDFDMQVQHVLVDGADVAFRAVIVGTHTGMLQLPAGEVAPTGQRVETPMAVFSRNGEDGLIVEEHRYYDLAGLFRQLGLA